jgi:heme-degrading monooxygenase HmoA
MQPKKESIRKFTILYKEGEMFIVIRKYYIIPGRGEEWVQRVQGGLVPLLYTVPGFLAHYDLEVHDDEVVSISLFEAQEAWEASQPRTARWTLEQLTPLLQTFPEITTGQVKASSHPLHRPQGADEMRNIQYWFA